MAITALPLDCWLKERLKNWVQLSGHEESIVYSAECSKFSAAFIEIQDLTAQFTNPAIMDIKIGTRFVVSNFSFPSFREFPYFYMIAQNPTEPTDEERREMAITKLRYMQFRERESSTASLGFRIEAAKMPGGVLKKSFKKVKTRDEVTDTLRAFFGDHPEIVRKQFLYRLRRLRDAAQRSYFFKHHEVSVDFRPFHEKVVRIRDGVVHV
uniref:Kinase n=1 Tax=Parascaris equorum TaxID=6256 RepID=A0A914RRN2_PAREQ